MALGKSGSHSPHGDDYNVDLPSRNEYEKYDPADFIVPAQDTKGHSERVWCRLQPGHDRQLEVILGSRKFPFRSKGDIIRWAVVRGIKMLEQMEAMPSVTAQVDIILQVMKDEEFQRDFGNVFESVSKNINAALASGPRGINRARQIVAQFKMHIMKMPDGYWKEEYSDRFEREYGHLLEAKTNRKQ